MKQFIDKSSLMIKQLTAILTIDKLRTVLSVIL
jgi:hypothetical protein